MSPIGSAIRLSIVIPVYNAEKHLGACVDSVLRSRSDAFEIILVDDGSHDGSPAICDDLARRHERVRAIHQQNSGAAVARNAGLDAAEGDYAAFIDADDRVDEGYADFILSQIERGDDAVVFPMVIDYPQTNASHTQEAIALDSVSAAEAVRALDTAGMLNMPCSRAFRIGMLQQEPVIRFIPDTEPGEDLIFNCDCFKRAQRVSIIDRAYYHWIRRGEDTLANRFRRDLTEKNRMFIRCRCDLYRALGLEETDYPLLAKGNLAYVFSCIPNMYRGKNKFPHRERIAFFREIFTSEEVARWVAAADTTSSLMKTFTRLYHTKSPFLADSYYSAALWARRRFDKLWQIIRKRLKK